MENISANRLETHDSIGTVLTPEDIAGRYQKLATLGKGSFGKAYLIRETATGTDLVLKQIGTSKKPEEGAAREAALLATLDHPNIVKFRDAFWTTTGRLCLVMTYCDGGDLHTLLKKRNGEPLPEKSCMNIFIQICLAVKHIHQRRIIHRDLKTSNVFLMSSGLVKLGDFGISRKLEKTRDLAQTMVGTPYYLSPEILTERGYNFMSDIWSLGVILYELTTLRHPFDAGNLHSLALRIMKGDFIDPDTKLYSKECLTLIRSMLNQVPESRPKIDQILAAPFLKLHIQGVYSKYPEIARRLGELGQTGDAFDNLSNGKQSTPVQIVSPISQPAPTPRQTTSPASPYEAQAVTPLLPAVTPNLDERPPSGRSSADTVEYPVSTAPLGSSSVEQTLIQDDEEVYGVPLQVEKETDSIRVEPLTSGSDGIFEYIARIIGTCKAERLFSMIQRRIDQDERPEGLEKEAVTILQEHENQLGHILPLAEAAIFLLNACELANSFENSDN